eukprot:NODE_631_length_1476_cov_233.423966_g474_i0.p1 GENE.NODE_631_length_1476_cov_233.423966_g474_i0~~NODE_631_length_1476_cov_233.423966_g474_i0.p1  ORF type:complete len:205 (-),score=14.67 NODE_631_length_1476_cov_233.423966_g474_i0:536-1150(-)
MPSMSSLPPTSPMSPMSPTSPSFPKSPTFSKSETMDDFGRRARLKAKMKKGATIRLPTASATLTINIKRARNLDPKRFEGSIHPVCVITCDTIENRTAPQEDTTNPIWNETFEFSVTSVSDYVGFEVLDNSIPVKHQRKQSLGFFNLKLTADALPERQTVDKVVKLLGSSTPATLEFSMQLKREPFPSSASSEATQQTDSCSIM